MLTAWLITSLAAYAVIVYWMVTDPRDPRLKQSWLSAMLSLPVYGVAFSMPIPAVLLIVL